MIKQSWSNIPVLKSETQKYKYYRLIDLNDGILEGFVEIAMLTNSEFIGLIITGDAGPESLQIFNNSVQAFQNNYNIHELGICIKYNPDNFVQSEGGLLTKYSNLLDIFKLYGEDLLPHIQEISEQDYLQHVDNCIQAKLILL